MDWRKFFRPQFLTRTAKGEMRAVNGGGGVPVLVAPRSSLSFERVSIPGSTRSARKAASLSARQSHPERPLRVRYEADRDKAGGAGVWAWKGDLDAPFRRRLLAPPTLPEPLIYEPLEDGARLIRCIEGVEGQVWRNGSLIASRWWRAAPSDQEWRQFLRRAGGDAASAPPTPIDAPLRLNAPPLDRDPENLRIVFSPLRLAAMLGLAFIAASAFLGLRFVVDAAAVEATQARIAAARQENASTLRAKRSARAAAARLARARQSNPDIDVAAIAAAALTELPPDQATLSSLRVANGEFEIVFEPTEALNLSSMISGMEKTGLLTDVYVDTGTNQRFIALRGETPVIVSLRTESAVR